MKPEIKSLHSPNVLDLESYSPKDNVFEFPLEVYAGPEGVDRVESFDFMVYSVKWLSSGGVPRDTVLVGKDSLVMYNYDFSVLKEKITELMNSCTGSNWIECAEKFGRYGHWEYEYYRPEGYK
ncbi:MAG: hypothetical protein HY537_02030 [Deltaproteobacteria bacterium]|nr:hypothetical protein [Deltaproteobacteria bacterium]